MPFSSDFVSFLIKAKKATYASGLVYPQSSRPGSRGMQYEEEPYLYIDSYLGEFNFIGEEAVWENKKYIWGMNYYGKMLVDHLPEGFLKFLQTALMQIPAEAPFRGPEHFVQGEYTYTCFWSGALDYFWGQEKITLKGNSVYQLLFHGGDVSD